MRTQMPTSRVSAVCPLPADDFTLALSCPIKDLPRVQNDAALGNSPLWFGEWGLPTQFAATDDFLFKWADAQKLAYSQGAGWIVSDFLEILKTWRKPLFP